MNYIDESTHLELINVAESLAELVVVMAINSGRPLRYDQMAMINKARELVNVARSQARAAGILIDGKIERGGDQDGP